MNPVLFLTACINPKGMVNTAIQNVNIRRKQYYEALKYYIYNTDYRIVFVDNSGYDISPDFIKYINEGRLEVITIDNNNFNKKLGKGYGEWLIIYHGILNSKFINKDSIIIKVTGRHIIKNINAIYSMTKLLVIQSLLYVVILIINQSQVYLIVSLQLIIFLYCLRQNILL